MKKIRTVRTLLLTLFLCSVSGLFLWDKITLDREHWRTLVFLKEIYHEAVFQKKRIIVRFGDKVISTSDGRTLKVPHLWRVRYDTTLGKNMAVIHGIGKGAEYNLREHGGDLSLRSYSRLFQRHIAISCVGFPYEGLYPGLVSD
ncbi:MAG: hypothetical protein V2I97_17625 [Desulfococcaceae bacterium]|nr:hypothetical protein [Desulfococcaceae bacterium]